MGLYNFKERFVPMIQDGTKRHTIRAERRRPDQPGNILHLYTGLRRPDARLIFRAPCLCVEPIEIRPEGVFIAEEKLSLDETDALAWRDGFRYDATVMGAGCFQLMLDFWKGRLPFIGHIVHLGLRAAIGRPAMLNAAFRPVEQWPGKATPTYSRRRAKFKTAYSKTLDLVERELFHLGAKHIVIQAYFRREEIRNDGWPKSSARPSAPGVILNFYDSLKDAYSYPCDTFDAWEDNLRAIALSLEALRTVDRYGVTRGREQYQGFKRLEGPSAGDPRAAALYFIATQAGVRTEDVRLDLDGAYRLAARRVHPDRGGSHDLFLQLQTHYRTLKVPGGASV